MNTTISPTAAKSALIGVLATYSMMALWAGLIFSTALVEVSFVFSLVFWLALKFKDRSWGMLSDRSFMPFLFLFVGLSILSFFWSDFPDKSFRGIFKILQQVLIFVIAADVFSEPKFRSRFERFFLLLFLVLAVDGFIQYAFGKDLIRGFSTLGSMAGPRVSASFKTYGLFASYLVCNLPFLFALGLRWRNIDRKWIYWYLTLPALVAGVVLLFLTRSRGAILALILGLAVFLVYRKKFAILGFFSAALIALLFVLPPSMVIHLDGWNKEQSVVERYYLWDRAVQVIQAKPLGGTGINTYASAHALYDKRQNWRVQNYYAHNGYLQMAAEVGIPALTFFLVFLAIYFRRSLLSLNKSTGENKDVAAGILLGIFNFLILAAVDTVLHNPQAVMTFWFLLGLQMAYQEERA